MENPNSRGQLEIGTITKPHGVRGDVRVRLHNERSNALEDIETLTIRSPEGTERIVTVEHSRWTPKGVLLKLERVEGRDAAEDLRGYAVLVDRSALPPLEPGEYYLVDLVGCAVFLRGTEIGRVVSVRPDPTIETAVIETPEGEFIEQPLQDAWVERVDVEARRMELSSDDGLIR